MNYPKWRLFVFLSFLVLQGCFPVIPPPGATFATLPANIENPDAYRVDSASYPTFKVKQRFDPPRWKSPGGEGFPMASIEPTDTWRVTHKVGDLFLIYSDTYNDRQCRSLVEYGPGAGGFVRPWGSRCHSHYLHHISVSRDGTVRSGKNGGWMLLYNPEKFIFSRDRYINLQIDPATPPDWGPQPLFKPIAVTEKE